MKTWRRKLGVTLATLASLSAAACETQQPAGGGDTENVGTATQALTSADKWVTGYWTAWDGVVAPANVPWTKLTHINVAFVGIDRNYKCKFWTDWLQQDIEDTTARANAQTLINYRNSIGSPVKIVLSVGGWSLGYRFSTALTSTYRSAFIDSCVQLMSDIGADGLDFDWEYPGRLGPQSGFGSCKAGDTCQRTGTGANSDYQNFADFLTEMRGRSTMNGKLMTAATRANGYKDGTQAGDGSQYIYYPYSSMETNLDRTYVMAYDLHGTFDPVTGHNANYAEVQNTMNFWKSQFTNDAKLGMGLPFYGYLWTGATASTVGTSASAGWGGPNGNGQAPYNVIMANWNTTPCTDYSSGNDRWKWCNGTINGVTGAWISWDPPASLQAKIDWWNTYSYTTMYWVMGQDSGSTLTDIVWNRTGNTGGAGDTTAPSQPGTVTTSAITSSSIQLNWAAATDNVGVTGYRVFKNGVQVATTTSLNYNFTGLSASTSYTLGVAAYDAAGNVSLTTSNNETTSASGGSGGSTCPAFVQPYAGQPGYQIGDKVTFNSAGYASLINGNVWSPSSYPAAWTTANCTASDTTAPTTPTSLSSSGITASAITLSWTASTDNVGVTGYKLYKDGVYVTTVTTTSYQFTGLLASTAYSLSVTATDAAGNNSTSATLSATTAGSADATAPSQPASPSTSGITASSITLSWSASTDTGGSGLAGYHVYRNGTFITNVTGTSYTFTGLAASTAYTLGVRAYDNSNNESGMATATATTSSASSSCPAFVQPYAPSLGYMLNDKVSFNGQNYKSLINNNSWSPTNYPGGWQSGVTCP